VLERLAAEDRWVKTEIPFDVAKRIRSLVEAVEKGHSFLVVAEAGEHIVGNLVGMIKGEVVAIGMGIDAAYRARGIGGALLDEAIAWSTRAKFRRLYLEVYAHNAAALALYRSRGFVELTPGYVDTRHDGTEWETLRMGRPIVPSSP
jgi:ribosomal protein S18 acetylase RimI-like enzyme